MARMEMDCNFYNLQNSIDILLQLNFLHVHVRDRHFAKADS